MNTTLQITSYMYDGFKVSHWCPPLVHPWSIAESYFTDKKNGFIRIGKKSHFIKIYFDEFHFTE